MLPQYCGILLEQNLMLNRRRRDIGIDQVQRRMFGQSPSSSADGIHGNYADDDTTATTRIYVCATMWHESKHEMMQVLKSIMRSL